MTPAQDAWIDSSSVVQAIKEQILLQRIDHVFISVRRGYVTGVQVLCAEYGDESSPRSKLKNTLCLDQVSIVGMQEVGAQVQRRFPSSVASGQRARQEMAALQQGDDGVMLR